MDLSDRNGNIYAELDLSRKARTGFPETVFCQGKRSDFLQSIFLKLYEENGEALGTRATQEQYEAVKAALPQAVYDPVSRIIKAENPEIFPGGKKLSGNIAVFTAGTADIPVAEEAAQTAEFFGSRIERIYDVGVSGIHRLLDKADKINAANCIIAIAGMEGALASVIGGLAKVPVIAVPTSVGYGAGMGGIAALLAMINSCANGVSVVNIDNGYGAAYIAAQINRLAENKNTMS
ncbi:MAG: nickel pincer cofactor biosynthesis protein LarB [Elusimicrobiales bacterium]|nr:nickel pincer cofactor biosynthesis protein LarB [Elusimicrobiales bacterium]